MGGSFGARTLTGMADLTSISIIHHSSTIHHITIVIYDHSSIIHQGSTLGTQIIQVDPEQPVKHFQGSPELLLKLLRVL